MKYLHYYILLCSCLIEGPQAVLLSTGISIGDGPYGGASDDIQSNKIENKNDRKEESSSYIPFQDDSISISVTRNNQVPCESQMAKVEESVAIVTTVRRQQQQDYTSGTREDELLLDSERAEFRQYRSNLMSLALCFHEKGATSKAFQIYQGELRRMFKDYAFPLINIAYIYFRQGKPIQALNSLQMYFKEVEGTHVTDKDSIIFGTPCHSKAMFLEDCISALNLLGLTYFNLYDHQKAISAYNRALEIGENNSAISAIADIHENLGTLEYELGKYELARASFLRAFIVRNVRRLKVMGANNYKSADFMPFVQWALLVPPIPRSIEDAIGVSHAFNYSLDILETLIYQGGLGLEIHTCEDHTGMQNEIDDNNLNHHHEAETCLSIRRNHNDKTELSSLQRLVLRYLKPQDIQLMKNILPSVPPLSYFAANAVLESLHHFHIQFYGFHDRSSLENVSRLLSKVTKPLVHSSSSLPLFDTFPSIKDNNEKNDDLEQLKPKRRRTILFISCLFSGSEPHGQLVLDVIRRLPKVIFQCVAVGIGSKTPGKHFLSALHGKYYSAGNDRDKAAQLIMSLNPECIVYVENLNNPIMHFLAYERFAPIQILLMGAPVTGGIPSSIDYFLSGDRLEHPFRTQASGDLSHLEPYTEQVVLFDGQSISFPEHQYHPPQDSSLTAGEAIFSSYSLIYTSSFGDNDSHHTTSYDELNVPMVDGSIYMCFQNIFKIHPIFDSVIVKVLHGDPKGHFVLQAARINHKTNLVKDRIRKVVVETVCSKNPSAANTPATTNAKRRTEDIRTSTNHTKNGIEICSEANTLLSRIHFIPRVNSDQLPLLFQRATVVLHPFPFDGSKTASDVLGSGVPLVTFPQRYLRGRLASTLYATMALHEIDPGVKSTTCCVASDIGDYISKALRLGLDWEYRSRVAHAIQLRKHRIHDDQETSFEWARFLTRALGVRITDEDLARQMDYVPHPWQKVEFHSEIILDQQRRWKRAKMEAYILSQ